MSPRPSITAIAASVAALASLPGFLDCALAEDADPSALSVDVPPTPAEVLSALPDKLRHAFLAIEDDGFIRLEHNDPHAAQNHRDAQVFDADRALRAQGYQVWRETFHLEVSRALGEAF